MSAEAAATSCGARDPASVGPKRSGRRSRRPRRRAGWAPETRRADRSGSLNGRRSIGRGGGSSGQSRVARNGRRPCGRSAARRGRRGRHAAAWRRARGFRRVIDGVGTTFISVGRSHGESLGPKIVRAPSTSNSAACNSTSRLAPPAAMYGLAAPDRDLAPPLPSMRGRRGEGRSIAPTRGSRQTGFSGRHRGARCDRSQRAGWRRAARAGIRRRRARRAPRDRGASAGAPRRSRPRGTATASRSQSPRALPRCRHGRRSRGAAASRERPLDGHHPREVVAHASLRRGAWRERARRGEKHVLGACGLWLRVSVASAVPKSAPPSQSPPTFTSRACARRKGPDCAAASIAPAHKQAAATIRTAPIRRSLIWVAPGCQSRPTRRPAGPPRVADESRP